MDLQKTLQQAWDILLLKEPTMNQVAKDSNATQPAILMVVLTSIVAALGSYVFPSVISAVTYRYGVTDVVVQALVSMAVGVASLYITGYLAERVFNAKLDMNGYVRIAGHASVVNVLSFLPALSSIAGIWALVVMCFALNKIGKMTAGPIILLILLEGLIMFAFAGLFLGSLLGLGMGRSFF